VKVAGALDFGPPDVLGLIDVPAPIPGNGEVLISVRATAVNPTDTALRAGSYRERLQHGPPYVPGMEVAGVLAATGPGTDLGLAVGERVIAIVFHAGPRGGAYAEQVVVPASHVTRAPVNASWAEAATLPMNGLTALYAVRQLGVSDGTTVAVTGAVGAVGGYVVQLAKHLGAFVVADAAAADEALAASLGADVVVRRGPDVAARIRAAVPGGVDVIADCAIQGADLLPALVDGGRLGMLRRRPVTPERGIEVCDVLVSGGEPAAGALEHLVHLAEAGTLTLRVARTYPLAEAGAAHRVLERGGTRGRLVLLP
jgi:NADPH:quinone reductase-like Zn-dependent oxidoreductase